jgi:hypothetical protein
VRYEFGPSPEQGDWDANWLVVRGRVQLADGRSWSFTDPSLSTWEAAQLSTWLEGVGAGVVPPAEVGGEDDERLLAFTEPNLAFSLLARVGELVTIRVHLSAEAAPPWPAEDARGMPEYVVEIELTHDAVAAAAASWNQEMGAFPVR